MAISTKIISMINSPGHNVRFVRGEGNFRWPRGRAAVTPLGSSVRVVAQ